MNAISSAVSSHHVRKSVSRLTRSPSTFAPVFILILGMLINLVTYGSIQPLVVGLFFLAIFMLLFTISKTDATNMPLLRAIASPGSR